MMKKIGVIATLMTVLAVGLAPVPVMADGMADSDLCQDGSISDELKEAAGCNTTQMADTVVNNVIKVVLSFVGIIAVGVMIYGGVMFVMSTGDAGKVQRAKNVIIYGLVGLIVSLLAYLIVAFVSKGVS